MLSSLSTCKSLINYTGGAPPPLIGALKISTFVAGTTTNSIVNQYTTTTGLLAGSNLIVQNSNLPAIAGITNTCQFNTPVSSNSSNRVTFNNAFTFDSSVALSISVWVYCPGSNGLSSGDIKVFEGDNSECMLLWQSGSSQNSFNFNNTGSFTLNYATWNYIVCIITRSTRQQNVYINGVLSSSGSGVVSPGWGLPGSTSSISSLSIGRSLTSSHYSFYGFITDYRLYPRALTQSEITAIYNGAS